jgi:hypothetical protein
LLANGVAGASHGRLLQGRVLGEEAGMGLLAVNWVRVETAIGVFDNYYLGWREKAEKGEPVPKLTGRHRRAVLLVMEEAKSRKGMDAC